MNFFMRTLYESILDDIDTNLKHGDEDIIVNSIQEYINTNYNCLDILVISKKPNKSGLYEVSCNGNVYVKNKNITSLTNDMFTWATINDSFICKDLLKLDTLKGAPKKVIGDFHCIGCNGLKDLKGAPKEINGDFLCYSCKNLKSLKGAPKEVGKDFYCRWCDSLTSLEGAPQKVGGGFDCRWCNILTSLKGAPKEVGESFNCEGCRKKFKENDVRLVSNVKGYIYC